MVKAFGTLKNRFTGWVDVDLSNKGQEEAKKIWSINKKLNIKIDYFIHIVLEESNRDLTLILWKII